eukprot:TRINITY_DN59587_c0_g1_i2.p1 TRINITY_DN59587_c0_g1~~TRINITY_DN59587_c0_g1_i2.p1  ORF type:complete len:347 (+),score=149.98 TRINITY_DN59587_c0_g1_i2:52-1092(+)
MAGAVSVVDTTAVHPGRSITVADDQSSLAGSLALKRQALVAEMMRNSKNGSMDRLKKTVEVCLVLQIVACLASVATMRVFYPNANGLALCRALSFVIMGQYMTQMAAFVFRLAAVGIMSTQSAQFKWSIAGLVWMVIAANISASITKYNDKIEPYGRCDVNATVILVMSPLTFALYAFVMWKFWTLRIVARSRTINLLGMSLVVSFAALVTTIVVNAAVGEAQVAWIDAIRGLDALVTLVICVIVLRHVRRVRQREIEYTKQKAVPTVYQDGERPHTKRAQRAPTASKLLLAVSGHHTGRPKTLSNHASLPGSAENNSSMEPRDSSHDTLRNNGSVEAVDDQQSRN